MPSQLTLSATKQQVARRRSSGRVAARASLTTNSATIPTLTTTSSSSGAPTASLRTAGVDVALPFGTATMPSSSMGATAPASQSRHRRRSSVVGRRASMGARPTLARACKKAPPSSTTTIEESTSAKRDRSPDPDYDHSQPSTTTKKRRPNPPEEEALVDLLPALAEETLVAETEPSQLQEMVGIAQPSKEPTVPVVDVANVGTPADSMLACGSNESLTLGILEKRPPNRGADVDAEPINVSYLEGTFPLLYTNRNLRDRNIHTVSVGSMIAYAISSNGTVYSWGSADGPSIGRIAPPGLNDQETEIWGSTPQPVQGLENIIIVQVAAGNDHAAFLAIDGSVYLCGMYIDSEDCKFRVVQLPFHGNGAPDHEPHDPPASFNQTPVRIDLPGRAVGVFTGQSANFTYALLEDGTLYSWGFGNSGELARTASMDLPRGERDMLTTARSTYLLAGGGIDRVRSMEFLQPGQVKLPPLDNSKIVSVACGFGHVVLLAEDATTGQGRVDTCGLNNYGQLGTGDACTFNNRDEIAAGGIAERHSFELVEALQDQDIAHVAAGEYHVLALTRDGKHLFAWGRCDKGQLGLGPEYGKPGGGGNGDDYVATPTLVTFVNESQLVLVDVACGGSHSMARTDSGDVYTWGFTDGKDVRATGHKTKRDGLDIYEPTKLEMQVGSNGPRFMCTSFAGGPQGSLFLVKNRPQDVPQDECNGPN